MKRHLIDDDFVFVDINIESFVHELFFTPYNRIRRTTMQSFFRYIPDKHVLPPRNNL